MSDIEKAQLVLREASSCLDCVTLMRLARTWEKLYPQARVHFAQARRVALLCGATSDTYAPLLNLCLAARGLYPEIFQTPYGTWQQQILDSESALHTFRPEIAILHLTLQQLSCWPELDCSTAQAERAAKNEVAQILRWCEMLQQKHRLPIFLTNVHPPASNSFGNLAARLPASPGLHVNRVNLALAQNAPSYVTLVDVAGAAASFGVHRWIDSTAWYHAKQPMSYDAMPFFVQSLSALIASSCMGSTKCIVLDLDNTLWGGVVADDGIENIRLGQGSAEGEAYQDFQRYLLELRRRGILLAVCSKNEESIAREIFEKHDQMLVKLSDLSAFIVNFSPKADNARQIAHQLNIGLDSLVFLDDNPAEREQMRQLAPQLKVVELPADPGAYVRALEQSFLFETPTITQEDLTRAESYAANQKRTTFATQITDIQEFLRSLDMRAVLAPYGPPHLDRITQLINKSNQFNLCVVRYTPAEVESIALDPSRITLSVRLRDRFGDNGLISAVHGRTVERCLAIENWVMSCRVLDRGVEQVAINHLVSAARQRGCKTIQGTYLPTPKNGLVREHYRRLGFELVHTAPDGGMQWKLDVKSFLPFSPPIQISMEPA